jgi:signal transduction histidine kinase/CheY-like chemotaxis protein
LGYTVEELTSRPYQDFVHPDDIARTLAARDRLAAGAAAVSFENRYHRKDGSYRWLLWNVAPAPGRSLVYAAARDITDRKETEHALAVARDQAVQATQLKSQFLATMSHEIRTPINGVIGLTSLLLETQLDRTQRRYAEGVRIAGDTLLSLINDILDFSKIEAGKIILDEIDFEPRRLVEEVTEVVAGTARAKDLELIGYCEPDVPCVVAGDENRIRQILLNLASNAVKFTHEGEVVISADLLDRPAPEARHVTVRFEVRDTGIGIAAADTERLFEAFSQADASTTRTHGGTGLGLAISRRLAELMGGEIGVESEPGKGSRFWCTLPLRLQSMNESAQRFSDAGLDGLRVLIVDDNATNRLVLEQQLLAWRMNPTATDTGDDALARLRAAAVAGNPFDVAILDMHMPVMDGAELARRITADPNIPPVHLALASSGADVDAAAAASAGVACRLTKPVHQSQLFECLARVTEPAPATEPARAEGAERVAPANGSRGHVLLVEDNEVNQTVGLGMLARLGYTADVANNGVEALEKLAHSSYDAVLMDGQMPKMDGFEATAEIRRREKPGDHVPVIAMTAAAFAEDRARCLAAGMDDYISKPISRDALDTVLSRWITERNSD